MHVVIGAPDAVSVRLLDALPDVYGLWMSSFEIACALGVADFDTAAAAEEMINHVEFSSRLSSKAIFVDVGNAVGFLEKGIGRLVEAARDSDLYLVVDDTEYPRRNSFHTTHTNAIIDVQDFVERTRDLQLVTQKAASERTGVTSIIVRTEGPNCGVELEASFDRIAEVMVGLGTNVAGYLIHGCHPRAVAETATRRGVPGGVTLATLCGEDRIRDLVPLGLWVLVVPSLFTLHRHIAGRTLVENVLNSSLALDLGYSPFVEILSGLEFD